MKILYILSSTTVYGGGSKAFMNMLIGLLDYNITPMVICPDKKGLYKTLEDKGIPVKALIYKLNAYPSKNTLKNKLLYIPRLLGRLFVNGKATKNLYKIVTEFQPEIIHSNVSVMNIGYKVARKKNIPHVWHIREYADLGLGINIFPSKLKFEKELNSKINHSICITKGIQNYYKLNAHSTVIYDGVLACNDKHFKKEKQPYFLFAGRLEENKGIKDVIMAFLQFCKQSSNTDIQLWIAGDTNDMLYYNEIISLAENSIFSSQIIFLGMRKDIDTLMINAMALIVSSYWEGFGLITAEAMFNGCLVIGKNTSGTKEQFDNGLNYTGKEIALRYNTQDELVLCMKNVVSNGIEYYFPMINLAQNIVTKLYSRENHAKSVYEYYNEIIR